MLSVGEIIRHLRNSVFRKSNYQKVSCTSQKPDPDHRLMDFILHLGLLSKYVDHSELCG